jgi:hypothetical protein
MSLPKRLPLPRKGLTDRHYRLLGRIAVHFANLELALGRVLAFLISTDLKTGFTICAQLSFQRMIDLAGAMDKTWMTEQLRGQLDKLLIRVIIAEEKRNQIVHSYWLDASEETAFVRLKISATRKRGLRTLSLETGLKDLRAVDNEILRLYGSLMSLGTELKKIRNENLLSDDDLVIKEPKEEEEEHI